MRPRCRRLFLLLGLFQGLIFAQFNSAIQGVVTDNSNAVVPGTAVTVTNTATGVARTSESQDDGLYRVLSLPPGTYRILVRKPGFADETKDGLTLTAGQTLRVDFNLRVTAQTEQVTVQSQANQVDTEQGNI